jgi:hypothetical protein
LSASQRFHEFFALVLGLIVGEFLVSSVLGLPYWLALLFAYKKSKIAYYALWLIEYTISVELLGCLINFGSGFIRLFFIFEFVKFMFIGISIHYMRRELQQKL